MRNLTPLPPPSRSLHPLNYALIAGTAGFALNGLTLTFFGSTSMGFGGCAALLVALAQGPWWGLLAAAIASSRTLIEWGHPLGLLLFSAEAAAIGWLYRGRDWHPLRADLFFWALVGFPVALGYELWSRAAPFPGYLAIALKIPANGMLAMLLAFTLTEFLKPWLPRLVKETPGAEVSLRLMLFQRFGLLATLPIAALGLQAGHNFDLQRRADAEANLAHATQETAERVAAHLDEHRRAIMTLARQLEALASRDPAALALQLAAVRKEYPGFLTMLVTDAHGVILATSAEDAPRAVNPKLAGVSDRDYFRQAVATRRPFVSNVFLGRGLGHDLIVAISAPVTDPAGRVSLVVEGSLNLQQMTSMIGRSASTRERDLVVTDSANQVVCSTGSLVLPALTSFAGHDLFFAAHATGEITFLHDQPEAGSRHTVRQLASQAQVPRYHWSVFLQEPVWRSQRAVAFFYLTLMIGAAMAVSAALLMARGTTAVATRPIEGLVESARALAQIAPAVPASDPLPAPTEMIQLSRSVHTATVRLSENNAELEQTNRELRELARTLDQRVQERTAELEEARAVAESANRAKSEFLASMSHELRTPLSVILGNASLLGDGLLGQINLRQADSVKGIDESGQHLLSLINDILDLSKIEAGMLELDYADVDAIEICEAAVRMIASEAEKKNLTVVTDYTGAVETSFVADARRTKQIVVNLLTNAVKFTPANGRISLKAAADHTRGAIDFCVSDNGIGIALDRQRKLFRPFVQIDSRLAREYAGTGLGLALVKQLTDLHGGSVSLVSAPEQGSTFTVSLPLRRDTGSRIPFPLRTEPAGIGRIQGNPLILAAEDHETNIAVLRAYFNAQSCRVVFARDGLEAIERALATPPDVILMDVQMPRLDGLEAIKRLREDERTARVPIVCLTALGMVDDRERCLRAGADYYICKPINFPELTKTINQLLAARTPPPA